MPSIVSITAAPRKHILVLDDDADLLDLIDAALCAAGYEVARAVDGHAGVRHALANPPDLVLCDVLLPRMDGFAVARVLRSDDRFAAVPLIFLTGLDDRVNFRRAMRLGADDYLTKPFEVDELLEAVEMRFKRVEAMTQRALRDVSAPPAQTKASAQLAATQPSAAAHNGPTGAASTQSTAAGAKTVPRSLPRAASGAPMRIEGYRLLKKIGQGGMSQVFFAQSERGGPPHVLKVIEIGASTDGEQLKRFLQEYELLADLRHPNVARIYSQGFSGNYAYIGMEYFFGGDLRKAIKTGIEPRRALDYLTQIAHALQAIHEVGIVHRDLKPDNLMLRGNGKLALADFGVAKHKDPRMTSTANGDIVGTPFYLSPEQALGAPVDHRSDYYSLGVIFYEMLTGNKPYKARTASELFDLHVHAPVPQLPAQLTQFQPLLDGLMAKQRERRFSDAHALLRAVPECDPTQENSSKVRAC
jgi:eukaryotic-like serine/threonine-protein kinase